MISNLWGVGSMDERLDVAAILGRMASVVAANSAAAIVYVVAITAISSITDLLSETAPGIGVISGIAQLAGGYLLLLALVRGAGVRREGEGGGFGAYFVVGILGGLGMLLGFLLLVVPGIVLMVRWLAADSMVLSEDKRASEALSASWDMTRDQFWPLLAVMLIGLAPFVVGVVLLGVGTGFYEVIQLEGLGYQIGVVITNALASAYTVYSSSLSVAVYWLLRVDRQIIDEVFA